MRILLAGYGYLGAKIAEKFAAAGHHVTVLRRSAAQAVNGIEFVKGDLIMAPPQLSSYDFDVAVFCLAPGSRSGVLYEQTYVAAQKNFLQSLHARQYIYISSTAVYPDAPGTYSEEAGSAHTERARILLEAEAVALSQPQSVVLRLAGLYSHDRPIYGQHSLKYEEDKLIHFIHRDDAVAAIAQCITGNLSGVYNIHDGRPQWRSTILARFGVSVPAAKDRSRVISNEKISSAGFSPRFHDYFEGVGERPGIG